MATLRAAIDARGATSGAREFDRAAGKMKRSAGAATKAIERGFGSAMRRIMMFGGAGGAIYMLKKFVDSASDAQETMNKFNVVFKDNKKEAAAWAEAFGDSVGRATQDVQKWMAGLQDLFVPLGFARKEAMGLSMDLTKLAVDVASFNNQADADVIRDFTSALVGNHETVRKYGIIISETSLKQEAYNQGIEKTYNELTDLEKVHLRMSLIQKGTTDAQGDAIRSAGDYAQQVVRLKGNLTELSTELGGPVMDALSDILEAINENDEAMREWASNTTQYARDIAEGFGIIYRPLKKIYDVLAVLQKLSPAYMIPELLDEVAYRDFPERKTQYIPEGLPETLPKGELTISPWAQDQIDAMNSYVASNAEANSQILKDEMDLAHQREDITAQMYDDMGGYGDGYYQAQKALLDRQKIEYGQYIDDKVLLDEWYHSQLQKLSEESFAKQKNAMDDYLDDLEQRVGDMPRKWADAAGAIEFSMANAFDSMISEGASFKDAMTDFARDIGRAFSRMAAQMMAEMIMLRTMGMFSGGGMQAPAGGFPGSSTASAMGNVFDSGRVVPMADGAIFNRPTYFPMADGNIGLIGEGGPEAAVPLKRMRSGRLGVETDGQQSPNINFQPQIKMVIVRNEQEAQIEAMKTPAGQKVIMGTYMQNRRSLS